MTGGQKTALSLLITVILFGAFTVACFAGLFSAIDARFYEPKKLGQIEKRVDSVCAAYDEYMETLSGRFALGENSFLKNPSVKTFVESRPLEGDVQRRSELLGALRTSTQGLLGLRILDKNQNSIHYSTFRSDVLKKDSAGNLTAYKNYSDIEGPDGAQEIPSKEICSVDAGTIEDGYKTIFDKSRIIFSFPLYDKYSVFRGSAIFYVAAQDFNNVLLKKNLSTISGSLKYIGEENGEGGQAVHGFALDVPGAADENFSNAILSVWKEDSLGSKKLFSLDNAEKNFWVSYTKKSGGQTYITQIFNDEILRLPLAGTVLILACFFASIFLISFLILNLRRDDVTVIRERIKTLQLGVVEEYLSKKEALDWETFSGRREAVTKEIVQSLGRRAKKHPKEVEELINRSWDELCAAMNLRASSNEKSQGTVNTEEIKEMLEKLLSSGNIKVQTQAAPQRPAAPVEAVEEIEPVEDVEAVEEIEEIEEAEPMEEAEAVEELEEIPDAEPSAAVEEIEPVEEIEEIEEAEPVEEAEAVEELEEIPDAEPSAAVEEIEPVEEIEEVESIDEIGAAPEKADRPFSHGNIFDISENIEDNFFAKKSASYSAEKKQSESVQKPAAPSGTKTQIENLDSFKKIRDAWSREEDSNLAAQNFNVEKMDYKDLDSNSEAQKMNGTIEEEKKEFNKELSPEDFGIEETQAEKELSEEIGFSSPEQKVHHDEVDIAATFTTETPHFENLMKKTIVERASAKPVEAVPLFARGLFTVESFAQNFSGLTELPAADESAITQGSDGVYSIDQNISTSGVKQDNSFKALVDSVLYHSV